MKFASRTLELCTPRVMGILNLTPDSFSDGGEHYRADGDLGPALAHAEAMVAAGASIIDVGGESTRPGAESVSVSQELDRVIPVIEALHRRVDCVISVDTSTPDVMREAVSAGAGLINDVRALRREGALAAAAVCEVPVCLMHMQGEPGDMQRNPAYDDVVGEVLGFLENRIEACKRAGISSEKILVDPGFGFGKSDHHNLELLRCLREAMPASSPILVGLSRKSLLGRLLGRELQQRLPGSLALNLYALQHGAAILRVHDVAETVDVVRLYNILENGSAA